MIITDPAEIEKRSMEIIEHELPSDIPSEHKAVVKRVIHCTADFDYARNLIFSDGAVHKGLSALQSGCDIVTDTQMAYSGINKAAAAKLGCTVHCFMSDPDVAEVAKERGCTRAVVSMEKAAGLNRPLIYAIGNAPTALLRLRQLIDSGETAPALVIGVPVGFVNIIESKDAIIESEVPFIVVKDGKRLRRGYTGGLKVVISAPAGTGIAKRTFNPKLGIEGGISILGTTGIVDPMSEEALIESIALEIRQRKALGDDRLIMTSGNFGAEFLRTEYNIAAEQIVKCSNYVGKSLEAAVSAGFSQVLLAGHIGKLIKLAGGMMNTHSKEGDCRAELMASAALLAGADAETARRMMDCITTDEMLRILKENSCLAATMQVLRTRIDDALSARFAGHLEIGVIVFTAGNVELFKTGTAQKWMEEHT